MDGWMDKGINEGLSLCSRHSLLKDKLASPSPRTGIKLGTKNHKGGRLKLKRWKHKLAYTDSICSHKYILDTAANSSLYCCPTIASEHLP